MLLIAPGKTWHTPVVATVSSAPVDRAADSIANAISAAARKCVAALRHQHRARMSSFALNHQTEARGCGDRSHYADLNAALFQLGALFNMQLDKR